MQLHKTPLAVYIIGTIVIWAIILGLMWFLKHYDAFHSFTYICAGFFLGMLAMFIAVHLYNWK